MGTGLELDAIAAVVIGGTLLSGGVGYLLGTLLGVLIFGTIQSALVFDGRLNSWWLRIAVGTLLLAFILLQRFLTRGAARHWLRAYGKNLVHVYHDIAKRQRAPGSFPSPPRVSGTRRRKSVNGRVQAHSVTLPRSKP